jgi:hypothetical protein
MFDTSRWALLPDDAIIQQYSERFGATVPIASRENFPVIEVAIHVDSAAIAVAQELCQDRDDFCYRLIPVTSMERVAFTRRNEDPGTLSANNFTVYIYPLNTLRVIVSHIRPKFVILATARVVSNLEEDATRALIRQIPTLETILRRSLAWRNVIPDRAKEDQSYWPPYDPGPTDDSDGEGIGDDDEDDDEYQIK